jgi:hypothetical protein
MFNDNFKNTSNGWVGGRNNKGGGLNQFQGFPSAVRKKGLSKGEWQLSNLP